MNTVTLDKDLIKTQLHAGTCTVVFTKANGDERTMECTLQESVLPPAKKEDPLTQKKVRAVSDAVCVVYDVNAEGWRSFRWDSVKTFTA